jgi:phage repressor protein C with HTH and peptisase S24 domain
VLGLWPVLVNGPSMAPALRSGDMLLARRGVPVREGDLVVASFPNRPDIGLVVKRIAHKHDDGWWVLSDNEFVDSDSRAYGAATVQAKVIAR